MVKLKNRSTEEVYNDYSIEMNSWNKNNFGSLTSTKENEKKGKWYYEVTHVSGDLRHMIGFIEKNGHELMYYQTGSTLGSRIYFGEKDATKVKVEGYSTYDFINLSTLKEKSTIGVGIDIDNKYFIFRSSYEIFSFKFNITEKNENSWNAFVYEAGYGNSADIVHVNFGQEKFVYDPPFGMIAWNKSLKILSCKNNYLKHVNKFLIFTLIFDE
jgi:hypothetical protein